jgi:hypothetical protein
MTNELRDSIFKSMAWELEIQGVLNKIRKDGKERESYIANPKRVIDQYEANRKRRVSKLKEGK